MITGLCGFADLVRRHDGDVGSAELIDAARALALTDLADRASVRFALRTTMAWADVHPELFDRLFDEWFSGRDLHVGVPNPVDRPDIGDEPAVALEADTVDAARIHADDALTVEEQGTSSKSDGDGATSDDGVSSPNSAPAVPTAEDGTTVGASGDLAPLPPRDDADDGEVWRGSAVVELPEAPIAAELELARGALVTALERRRARAREATPRRVAAVTAPLSAFERAQLTRCVRRLDRELDGAASWRRTRRPTGAVDVRRTMRRAVTTAGLPIDVRYTGRRDDAARLVVLVDLSMSVRGTARLVLHLVHRMRSMLGSLRTFGFVDTMVPLDRALRVDDPAIAIDQVLGLVDVEASSDPGRALRGWWAKWHHTVTPATHVIVFGDGRGNGRDPAFGVVERVVRRSASTLWISPEPRGAWTLGRGEMAEYADRVDRAVSVRVIGDLDQLTLATVGGRRAAARGRAW